jgi:ribosome-associated protein
MRRRELPGGVAPPTKTELKRRAREVQDLADQLCDAPEEFTGTLRLPDKLADALALARRIPGGGALVRQRQYVAKLLRGLDLDPLRAAVDARDRATRLEAARFRRAERWRDRLVSEGDPALAEFVAEFPAARGTLAGLVDAAVAERQGGRSAGAGRELFRRIRDLLDSSPERS